MILLLGKNDLVENYAEKVIGIDIENELCFYPDKTTHYTEYDKEIECLREEEPPVVTSQNIEFINYMLDSDLDFEVWTVYDYERDLVRKLDKETAIKAHRELSIELR
jgi:hypothetical protein